MDKLEQQENFNWDRWAKLLHIVHEVLERTIEHIVLYVNNTLITYLTK